MYPVLHHVSCQASCSVKFWQPDLCKTEPLLAAVMRASRPSGRNGFMTFDTVTVANAVGISPFDVLRNISDFKKSGVLTTQSSDKALCLKILSMPSDDMVTYKCFVCSHC
eukprot:m.87853 g.87853  ORF g.87853 m.87853 type:complete len:110 (+) comp13130_c0_seq2:2763-3092(+)